MSIVSMSRDPTKHQHVGAASNTDSYAAGSDASSDSDEEDARATQKIVESTILIFDWDDTVCPSSWIQEQWLSLEDSAVVSEEQQLALQKFADCALEMLAVAKLYGRVVLVTNAEHGWIEMSCQKFMPSLFPALEDVRILSARSTYEGEGVDSPFQWKLFAFESEICDFNDCFAAAQQKNIISFGDSAHEREALIRVTERLPNCLMKSVKFVENPSLEQLSMEHSLLTGVLDHIVHYERNLDLCIRCS